MLFDIHIQVVYPPLSPIQQQLRKVCRLGDKELLRSFLSKNPGIELDVKDPDGGTILTETATKTAQFSDIATVLIDAGAGLEVTDCLGNTPLHNAVLYFPSTQKTLDLLLKHGADITAKNNEGVMPEGLAEDKDLKLVLKELRKAAGRKKSIQTAVNLYLNNPDMRKKVFDQVLLEEHFKKVITVKYNAPVVVNSPGLLKRKRKFDCLDDSQSELESRTKRIRWCELDSTGAEIDPQFSSEEDEEETYSEKAADSPSDPRTDSEEDVIIVHKDVKKSQLLESDTEAELCLAKDCDTSQPKLDDSSETDGVETYFIEESSLPAQALVEYQEEDDSKTQISSTEVEIKNISESIEFKETRLANSSSVENNKPYTQDCSCSNDLLPVTCEDPVVVVDPQELPEVGDFSPQISDSKVNSDAAVDLDQEAATVSASEAEVDGSENKNEQLVLKCSQGFGFFVS